MPRITVDQQAATAQPVPATPAAPVPQPLTQQTVDPEVAAKSSGGMFSAFSVQPSEVQFGESEEGEQILLLLRAHLVTNVPWILITIGLLVFPIILIPLLSAAGGFGIGAGAGFVFFLFWYATTATYAFLNFLYWYFNVYIVTNERIIDTDWYSVVVRKVSSTQIAKLQDVNAVQVGALQGIFDYGNVRIETAAEEENFEFENVPHPQLVAKQINELMQKEEEEGEGGTV